MSAQNRNVGLKKRHKYRDECQFDTTVTCPRCGTKHHFDLGCDVCSEAQGIGFAVQAYERICDRQNSIQGILWDFSKTLSQENRALLERFIADVASLADGFRHAASDIVSESDNNRMGMWRFRFTLERERAPERKQP